MAENLGDLWKKGTSSPLASDLVEGGLAIDVAGKKVYSKGNDGGIFTVGGFDGVHNDLEGRSTADAHPLTAITGLSSTLDGKEDDLGIPTVNDMMLSSKIDGSRSWITPPEGVTDHLLLSNIGTKSHAAIDTHIDDVDNPHLVTVVQIGAEPSNANIQAHIADLTTNPHGVTASDVGASPEDHDHDDVYFTEAEHLAASAGTGDVGKPVKLNANGKLDSTFLDFTAWTHMGSWNPSVGEEYPDETGLEHGAFYNVVEIIADTFTFTGGDLAGQETENGDMMVFGLVGWTLLQSDLNPDLYYMLDGSVGLTGAFAGGGQIISNIADGVVATDAVAMGQIASFATDFVEKAGDEMTGNLIVGTGEVNAQFRVSPNDDSGYSSVILEDGSSFPRITIYHNNNTDYAGIQKQGADNQVQCEITLEPDGNLSILEDIVPAKADDLTPKKYVDDAVASADGNLDDHIADVANPHAVTKSQVGLGSVANLTQDEQFFIGAY